MRVMIIGASADRSKFGNKAVRAHLAAGDTVLPVNPAGGEIEGLRVSKTIAEAPGPIERAVLYVREPQGLEAVAALAARGDVTEVWLSPGADSDAVVARAEALKLNPVQACSIVDVAGRHPED